MSPGLDYFAGAAVTKELIPAQAAAGTVNGAAVNTRPYQGQLRVEMSAALATGGLADEAKELLPAQTASTTQTGAALATATYSGNLRVLLSAALASAGTAPTLDVTLETSANGTTGWTPVGAAFTQVTDAAGAGPQEQLVAVSSSLGYIRAVATIGGTGTPTFAFAVMVIGEIAAGSAPSMSVAIETSADGSTNWTAIPGAVFTTVTDTTGDGPQSLAFDASRSKGYVRAVATISTSAGQAFGVAVMLSMIKTN
jgi:hypothetical protein